MVERRCRYLDRAALRRRSIGRQHLGQKVLLTLDYLLLVSQGLVTALADQIADAWIVEEKLVHPGDLGKHLQVSNFAVAHAVAVAVAVLRLVKFLPQLAITRITADQVFRIGLKQVLDRE